MFACINANIILPDGRRAAGATLIVNDGKIAAIGSDLDIPGGTKIVDLQGNILAPGFVDLQVNGGGGTLFNDRPTLETVREIASAHYQFGTTAFLPTLISDDLVKIRQAYDAVRSAIHAKVPGVLGVHIEGPFLNVRRKGIHDGNKIRQLDDRGMDVILTDRPEITMMTLAPECVSIEQITALAQSGILLCAGHSEGTYNDIADSFDAGVIGVTHLFNAMSQLTGREPGAVGAALTHPDCWCCVILDGIHVRPESLRIAIKAKGSIDRFVLVTDAMPTVGQLEKSFTLYGEQISVRGGVCQNDDGTLAGSDLDMATAVANACTMLGMDLGDAIKMASANPAKMLGIEHRLGALAPGLQADMIEIGPDGIVQKTWITGQLMWDRSR